MNEPTLQDILKAIQSVGTDLKSFKEESTPKFDALLKDVTDVKRDHSIIRKKVANNESSICSLRLEVEMIKQKQLKNNICIGGVPALPGENLFDIVVIIWDLLGIGKDVLDFITGIYRTKGKTSSIIVQLSNEALKSAILEKKKAKKSLLVEELQLATGPSNTEVTINQQLTPYYSNLMYNGRQAVKNKTIHSCWFTNKGMLVKIKEDATPVLITTVAELADYTAKDDKLNKRRASSEVPNPSKKPAEMEPRAQADRKAKNKNKNST